MKCESCNKSKPECSCQKGFTPAVIKIENPEELVLFHKVVVPASMGDERDTPVTIGKYCNVLMVYEINGHAYLYSSDGIPSKIAFDSGGVLFIDQPNLPDVDKASVGFLYITNVGTAAITNDNENWVSISGGGGGDFDLLKNRPKVDGVEMTSQTDIPLTQIQNDINDNKTDIAGLNADLAIEKTRRETADDALSSRIDSLSSSLSTETAAREAGDAALRTEITNAVNTLDAEISADMATLDAAIQAEAQARATADADKVDKVDGKGLSTNDFTNADKDKLDSAIQPENIDYTVMTDLKMATTASTTSVVMEGDKVNLKEGTPSDFEIPLPVASATQAGVMNTATYQTIQDNKAKIEAIEGGAVAITGISANPSQADLTTAWQTATGQTTLINDASILDVDNDLRWTYYTNTATWYSADTSASVTINPFTNTEAGTIKGSNVDGQVHAETDGTGSVQGWDTVKADIANNAAAIATKVDAETGKGLSTNDFTNDLKTKLEGIEASAEVNDPLYNTTGSNTDGAMTQAAVTNALNSKVNTETGKGLSTNDFTDADKIKLDSLSDLYNTTGQNTDGAMTQKATTDFGNDILKNFGDPNNHMVNLLDLDEIHTRFPFAANRSKFIPYRTATTGKPDARYTWGIAQYYYGGEDNILEVILHDQGRKIAMNTYNNGWQGWRICEPMYTNNNLKPSADTTAAWKVLMGNPGVQYYSITYYTEANCFTNQPSQYGYLETFIGTGNEVYQRWHTQASGPDYYRSGNSNGWYGSSTAAGTFRRFVYDGLSNSITTAMINNNAVTSDKIDWTTIINKIYPVGSIYMSYNNTSPQSFIGGIWVKIEGRFLLAAGGGYNAGATGGSATHTLTVNEIPPHAHLSRWISETPGPALGYGGISGVMTTSLLGGTTGGGAAHNNMPPYLVVHMWRRTA